MYGMGRVLDIFDCPGCEIKVAHGDRFCKGCGRKFSTEDVAAMQRKNNKGSWRGSVVGAIFFGVLMILLMFFFNAFS